MEGSIVYGRCIRLFTVQWAGSRRWFAWLSGWHKLCIIELQNKTNEQGGSPC